MKFCAHCGKELFDEAVVCPGCGCSTGTAPVQTKRTDLIRKLSEKVKTNAIIWLVIGILQVLAGVFGGWFVLIVGVLNIVSSVQDMNYSKALPENPTGIVQKFEPLTGPIITLCYNLVLGGIVGVVGSIYYFVGIRSFVMENREALADQA